MMYIHSICTFIFTFMCMQYVHTHSLINILVCTWYRLVYTASRPHFTSQYSSKPLYLNLSEQLVKTSMCLDCFGMHNAHTWHVHVHTVYIQVHTLYMGTTYYIHIPLWYIPLLSRLYCPCSNRDVLCYSTGIGHSVHRGFRQGHTI